VIAPLAHAAGGVDVLVVDEAAQATEAEIVVALQLQPSKCLLVGDPCKYYRFVFDVVIRM
jgi:hypothetical protein